MIFHYNDNFSEEVDILMLELGEKPLVNIRCIERLSIDHPRVKITVFTDKIDK